MTPLPWLALIALATVLALTSPSAVTASKSSYGVLASNEPVAIAMTCSAGYKLAATAAVFSTTDGSQLLVSRGSTLPLPADGAPTTESSYVIPSPPSSTLYYRITCANNANGYCAMQWDIQFYCKAISGPRQSHSAACTEQMGSCSQL